MSIEKMTLVNILGNLDFLNECILKLFKFKMFHIENADKNLKNENFKNLNETNPYLEPLKKIENIFKILNLTKNYEAFKNHEIKNSYDETFLNLAYKEISNSNNEQKKFENEIRNLENSKETISHIKNMDGNLNTLLNTRHILISFGKILKENKDKLKELEDNDIIFIPQDEDKNFIFCFLAAPKTNEEEFLQSLKKINFVECLLPTNLNTTPKNSQKEINLKIDELKTKLKKIELNQKNFKEKNIKNLQKTYFSLKTLHDAFNYRKFAVANKNQFNICGFIPTKKIKEFNLLFKENEDVVFEFLKEKQNKKYSPPVKLKTCRLFKPFEMYVTTYGTPQYKSINPSSFIGLIYSLVFGIMFGDFGQGFLLLVGGFVAWKKKKNNLGLILTRCGFSSMIFGLIFDSVFGFEGIFENFWKQVGVLKHIPFHLLKASNSIPILVISCLFGMLLILISITINIFLNLKNKKFGEALFSHNGLAGLCCYGSCTVAVLSLVLFKKNIFNRWFVILFVIFPLILVFFSLPLENLLNKTKTKKEKFSFSSAIFDMIDILLSYFTNTLSFLRIGGLALSHAALMLVVMKFSKMAASLKVVGSFSGPLIVVLGNLFVVLLEGLIVSIQALRLIYYEIFSRFYQSNGKPFNPVKVDFKN